MNAVHGSIVENLRNIKIVYQETADVFKKDRPNTSDSKEISVSQFIKSYLPSDFQVKIQSKIYSRTQETNNIDCVILAPNHPKLITPVREVVLAEGVFSVIEVKPDISTLTGKSEFYRGLLQIKSVKNINRETQRIPIWELTGEKKPSDYYDKIPSVIFSSKSSNFGRMIHFMKEEVKSGNLKYDELPDLIVCLDRGIIFYSPVFQETSLVNIFDYREGKIPSKAFITYESSNEVDILILFLRYFLNFNTTYTPLTGFFIKKYLQDIKTNFEIKLFALD